MPNRKEIIVISVLCVLALMLGYWTAPLFDDNGDEEASVKPVADDNATVKLVVDDNATVKPVVDDNATKTVRKLTAEEEKVVGVYTRKNSAGTTYKRVFLDNRVLVAFTNNNKSKVKIKWEVIDGELHIDGLGKLPHQGDRAVARINKDGSYTFIAVIKGEKRIDWPPRETGSATYKKIK